MAESWDVVIVGAGAAGLAALRELDRGGLRVLCLEAQDRIGGRILTVHDPFSPVPVELGAEFVHGRPHEIWDIADGAGLTIFERTWNALELDKGKPVHRGEEGGAVGEMMSAMEAAADAGPDESFAAFAGCSNFSSQVKRRATRYVEGFNAADSTVIGIY